MRVGLFMAWLMMLAGCSSVPLLSRDDAQAEMFGPVGMNIHAFTALRDWTGDDEPDGIEAVIEFEDQFGDPTKASGTFIFELFDYRRANPDPRDKRLARWPASIQSLVEQRDRWNRISRTYTFQLAGDPPRFRINPEKAYVLTAIFQSSAGGRAFAQIVLEPPTVEVPSATQPATQPSTQPATAPASGPATGPASRP